MSSCASLSGAKRRRSLKRSGYKSRGLRGLGALRKGASCKAHKRVTKMVCTGWDLSHARPGCGAPGKVCSQRTKKMVSVCSSFGGKGKKVVKRTTKKVARRRRARK